MAIVNWSRGLCVDGRVGVNVPILCTPSPASVRSALNDFLNAYDVHFHKNEEPQPLRAHHEGSKRGKHHVIIEPIGRAVIETVLPLCTYSRTGWPVGHNMWQGIGREGIETTLVETNEYFFTVRYRS